MRIAAIDVHRVDLPYAGGTYRLSGGRTYAGSDAIIVRIETDAGLEGWGESTPFGPDYVAAHALGVRAGIAEMADALIGRDPRRVDRINEAMDQALAGHLHARTAIDVACWDLLGQATGLPVCDLLSGRTGHRMPVVDSIHCGDPDDLRRRVAEARARGFRGRSVKVGATPDEGGPMLDAARIEAALADARNDEYFLVDCNGALPRNTSCACCACCRAGWIRARGALRDLARDRVRAPANRRADHARRARRQRRNGPAVDHRRCR